MGGLGSCEGFDKPLNSNTVKAIVPIHKPAEDQWFRRAMEIFDHVNPYTGIKWKDDPAVLFVTLMNEDSIATVWWGAADMYVKKYNEWAKGKGYPEYPAKDIGKKKEFAEFLYKVKAEANVRMAKRLKDVGVHALISGGNWWDNTAQAYERETLEVVDNHGYGDHPQPSYQKLPFHVNQSADIKSGNPTYNEPMMKAPTRILGKPFTITEYNYCPPNKFRGDGGLMMGAYASLQDWDALYRFAWSHSRDGMFGDHAVRGFDICRDPIGQLTERQVVLMFGRGDVAPARETYGYGVTKGEAFGRGLGDMWANGLFPHPFTQLGYTSRIGSYTADNGESPKLACAKTWTAATKSAIPKFAGETVSDTKEIDCLGHEGDTHQHEGRRPFGQFAAHGRGLLDRQARPLGGAARRFGRDDVLLGVRVLDGRRTAREVAPCLGSAHHRRREHGHGLHKRQADRYKGVGQASVSCKDGFCEGLAQERECGAFALRARLRRQGKDAPTMMYELAK